MKTTIKLHIILIIILTFSYNTYPIPTVRKAKLQYFKIRLDESTDSTLQYKIKLIDSIINISIDNKNLEDEILYTTKKADLLSENDNFSTALEIYLQIRNTINNKPPTIWNKEKLETEKLNLLQKISNACYCKGAYVEGLKYLSEMIKTNKNKEPNYLANSYTFIGAIFIEQNLLDKAKKYLDEALSIIEQDKNNTLKKETKFNTYNNLGGYYFYKKNFDSALIYFSKSQQNCKGTEDNKKLSGVYQNIALVYFRTDELKIAEEYFIKAINISKEPYNKIVIKYNLGNLYSKDNNLSKALIEYKEALQMSEKIDAKQMQGQILNAMATNYAKQGEYKLAYIYNDKGRKITDSIFNNENKEKLTSLQSDLESFKIKSEKEALSSNMKMIKLENEKKTLWLVIASILFIILTTFIIFIIKKLLGEKRDNTQLKTEIKELNRTQKEELEISKQKFETEINNRNLELAVNTTSLAKTYNTTSNIREKIKKLSQTKENKEKEHIIDDILSILDELTMEKNLSEFRTYFERLHPQFFTGLTSDHQSLTKKELDFCSYISMGFSSKEIALITDRPTRTVESIKFRIRKKINPPKEVSTADYLLKYM